MRESDVTYQAPSPFPEVSLTFSNFLPSHPTHSQRNFHWKKDRWYSFKCRLSAVNLRSCIVEPQQSIQDPFRITPSCTSSKLIVCFSFIGILWVLLLRLGTFVKAEFDRTIPLEHRQLTSGPRHSNSLTFPTNTIRFQLQLHRYGFFWTLRGAYPNVNRLAHSAVYQRVLRPKKSFGVV